MGNKQTDERCPQCQWSLWCHDDVRCLQIQLSLAQTENGKLKASLAEWKATWYCQRDLIAELGWKHSNCPYHCCPIEKEMTIKSDPNAYRYENEQVCRDNNHVYIKGPTDWKLVGYGLTPEATEAIVRLMAVQ